MILLRRQQRYSHQPTAQCRSLETAVPLRSFAVEIDMHSLLAVAHCRYYERDEL